MEHKALLDTSIQGETSEDFESQQDERNYNGTWWGSVVTVMTCAIGSGVLALRKIYLKIGLNFYSICIQRNRISIFSLC